MAKQLHLQPAGVSAGSAGQRQGFLGRLHARLHADGILDVGLQLLIHTDQKVDGAFGGTVDFVEVGLQKGRDRFLDQVRRELAGLQVGVGEREFFGRGLQEEVKRVEHGHLNDQVHRDLELPCGLFKHQAGLVIGKRVLLPVDEMLGGLDRQ